MLERRLQPMHEQMDEQMHKRRLERMHEQMDEQMHKRRLERMHAQRSPPKSATQCRKTAAP